MLYSEACLKQNLLGTNFCVWNRLVLTWNPGSAPALLLHSNAAIHECALVKV
jgi:hypothetical protein